MAEFRLDLDSDSPGLLAGAFDALVDASAQDQGVELRGAWRGPDGRASVFIRGSDPARVSAAVQAAGMQVDSVAEVSNSDLIVGRLFPKDQVYCSFHGRYHAAPACNS